jgi:predicted DNA-binding protein
MQVNILRDKRLYERLRKVSRATYRSISSCVREAVDLWIIKEEARLAGR